MKHVEQIPSNKYNAEQFVELLVKNKQPLEGFEFTAWTNHATGFRWFSVERGKAGSKTHPLISQSYIAPEGDSLDAFKSAVAVAVMQAK